MSPPALIAEVESTLYPKITQHVPEIVRILKSLSDLNRDLADQENEGTLDPIPITGTVKLHGTHADILIYSDNTITFQSRNLANLSTAKDNHGFATAMSNKTKILLRLRNLYLSRWTQRNPGVIVDATQPVLIAGEWIGSNIQKDVAIAQLSKRFVIISVNINGQWQSDAAFAGISLPNHDIYNIARAGFFHATLYPEDIARTISELESIVEQVAAQCPFAATFGIEGEGEGLVWKLNSPAYNANPGLWFKTKGGQFRPNFARPPKKTTSFDTLEEKRQQAAALAQVWCSEQRLEQGWDVMREKGEKRNIRGLGTFLKWIQGDILVEERGYIRQYEVGEGTLRIEISKIAKPWYLARMQMELE